MVSAAEACEIHGPSTMLPDAVCCGAAGSSTNFSSHSGASAIGTSLSHRYWPSPRFVGAATIIPPSPLTPRAGKHAGRPNTDAVARVPVAAMNRARRALLH